MAGRLIKDSYSNWHASPISTTITTHPIDDLDFPTVTVCPPKGSDTSLNYDLMKADNNSLTEQDRQNLKDAVFRNIIKPSHDAYVRTFLATANPANTRIIFEGFQSTPYPDQEGGFELRMWNNSGTYQTPWFGEEYIEDYYKEDKNHKVVLEFPDDIDKKVGSGFLAIQLEVDTREEEGWKEEVKVKTRPEKFKFFTEQKNWTDAEAYCQGDGGHLASVTTEEERQEVNALVGDWGTWLGGSYKEVEKVWKWSDGSSWAYTHWADGAGSGGSSISCTYLYDGKMWDGQCKNTFTFTCRYDLNILRGNVSLSLTFTKEQLSESLQLIYSYQASSQQLLDSWENKRMTGYQLSWRTENSNPPLEMTTSEVGRSVQTPGFGGNMLQEQFYLTNKSYTSTLLLPTADNVGDGSLVIQLELDTGDEEGWQGQVQYGSRYKLYKKKKTWTEAEAHCQEEGGHLASVTTQEQWQQVKTLAGGKTFVNIGGSDQKDEGVWRWSDGSPWGFTQWRAARGSRGDSKNCLQLFKGGWIDYYCTRNSQFICQKSDLTPIVTGQKRLTLEYSMENFFISSFVVNYLHKPTSQKKLDSWDDKKITGFRLSWFLQDSNGSRTTEKRPDLPGNWKPETAVARYQEQYLVRMVELAGRARENNMTRVELLNVAIRAKAKLITNGFIQYNSMCSGGQVKVRFHQKVFDELHIQINGEKVLNTITEEDLETGFMLFSATIFCSEPVALAQFLHNLLTTQSPRTIIQATVNTIQSEDIKEILTRKLVNNFYLDLDKILHFHLGKIHLATTSMSQLQSMMAKDWPYFTKYTQHIDQCLNNVSCQGINDIIMSLGKS